jgi:dTDP-4-amino-4,6-dideoxygalactose transaminase
MGARARERLGQSAAEPVMARRRANWRVLAEALSPVALWPEASDPDFVPLAFPVRTPDAAETVRRMAEAGVFCARHWAELPCPAGRSPTAEALSRTLLSLPCDQRYGPADMRRIIEAFRAL